MAEYQGSASFFRHISVEADDDEEAEEKIEKRAEKIARKRELEVMDIVDVEEV